MSNTTQFGRYGVRIMFECLDERDVPMVFSYEAIVLQALEDFDIERAEAFLDKIRPLVCGPCALTAELGTCIGNTRALLGDAVSEQEGRKE